MSPMGILWSASTLPAGSRRSFLMMLCVIVTCGVATASGSNVTTVASIVPNASFTATTLPFPSTASTTGTSAAPVAPLTQQPTEVPLPDPSFVASIVGGERDVSLDGFEIRAQVMSAGVAVVGVTARWTCCRAAFTASPSGVTVCAAPCTDPLRGAFGNTSAHTVLVPSAALQGASLGSLYVRVSITVAGIDGTSNATATLRLIESGAPPVQVIVLGAPDWREGVQRFAALVPTAAAVTYAWRINTTALNAAASAGGATARVPLQALSLAWLEGASAPQPWRVSVTVCLVANSSQCATAQLWFRDSVKFPNASASCAVVLEAGEEVDAGVPQRRAGTDRISVRSEGLHRAAVPGPFADHAYRFLVRLPNAGNATLALDDGGARTVPSAANVTLPILPASFSAAASSVDVEILLVVSVGGREARAIRCDPGPFPVLPATSGDRTAIIAGMLQELRDQQANASVSPAMLMEAALLRVPWTSATTTLVVLESMVNASDRCAAAISEPACRFAEDTNVAVIDTMRNWGLPALTSTPLVGDDVAVLLRRLVSDTTDRLTTRAGGEAAFRLLVPLQRALRGVTAFDAPQLLRDLAVKVQALISAHATLGVAATVMSEDGNSSTTMVRHFATLLGDRSISSAGGVSVRFPAAFDIASRLGITGVSTTLATISAATFRSAADAGLPETARLSAATSGAELASGIVDVSVAVDGVGLVTVRALAAPIEIRIPLNGAFLQQQQQEGFDAVCAFYNETLGAWATDGVTASAQAADAEHVMCRTTHLTTFALFSQRQDAVVTTSTSTVATPRMTTATTDTLLVTQASETSTDAPSSTTLPSATPPPATMATAVTPSATPVTPEPHTLAPPDEGAATTAPPWTRGPFAAAIDDPWLTMPVLFAIVVGVCTIAAAVGFAGYCLWVRAPGRSAAVTAGDKGPSHIARAGFSEL